ncbi:MAG: hypothetical protein JWM68_4791 [Verrucomicrobiales bacterium]|nr:hypothetical protein [Verrucomicrobiales bacterium]
MKTFLTALVALVVGFGAAFAIVSAQKESALNDQRAKLEAQWRAEKEQLEAEMSGKRQPGKLKILQKEVVVASHRTPEEILQNLLTLKPVGATRINVIRKIVHELEDLADLKDEAVPSIHSFLTRNEDLDYSEKRTDEGDRGNNDRGWRPSRSNPSTEFTLPPSLRIGLFEVLEQIGTPAAESALAQVLSSSGRAVEVACVVRMLEAMAPGKYRELAINAAKDLLRNPLAINNPNRLDEQAENYLYAILEMYKDTTFAADAGKQLVEDGKLNRNARDYLTKTQGEQAIPALLEAYKSPGLSNEWDKASVASHILDFVGENQQANNLLNDIVSNPNIDSRMRSYAMLRLAGGTRGSESPTDPKVIDQRSAVIQAILPSLTEDRLIQAAKVTLINLDHLKKKEPIENPFGGDRRRPGGTGTTGTTQPKP